MTVDILDTDAVLPYIAEYLGSPGSELRIRPRHRRIEYIHGDSASEAVVGRIRAAADGKDPVMIIADSDHSFEHTHRELPIYHELVTPGSRFIVEDTDCPGPRQAVDAFLRAHRDFSVDSQSERFHLTFNPGGYLQRRA